MIGAGRSNEILDLALRAAQADQTEALVVAQDVHLTRFANNAIHQNVSESNLALTVRVVVGQRQGSATTNDVDEAAIVRAVATAREIALAAPEDPQFAGLPHRGSPRRTFIGFDADTHALDPKARAQAVGEVCRPAAAAGLTAAGAYRTGTREYAVANSHGVRAYYAGTLADFVTVVLGDDSAGYGQTSGWRVADLDIPAAGAEALDKAQRGRNPQTPQPGEYTVVLDPYATWDILHMLATSGMGAEAVQEGRSWMCGRVGQAVMNPAVSIWDDGSDPAGVPLPFDVEGVTRKRLDIVKRGVVVGPVYDARSAAREGKVSTGHAAPPEYRRWRTGPLPLNLFMAEGQATVEELIASTERGLYITRFWYTRLAHPRDCAVTGMTRDGVFQIENGVLAGPVKNLRFTQSYVNALASVSAVGSQSKLLMDAAGFGLRAPALKIDTWRFTGVTK